MLGHSNSGLNVTIMRKVVVSALAERAVKLLLIPLYPFLLCGFKVLYLLLLYSSTSMWVGSSYCMCPSIFRKVGKC